MLFVVCKYNKDVAIVSIFYVICNLIYTYLQTKWLSSEAKDMFTKHGEAINSYDDNDNSESDINKSLTTITGKEDDYEELRFKFNEGINTFVFFQMVFYYLYASGLVYVFAKRKHCELSSIITMLLFIARYYNTILLRSKMFIESVARLRLLKEKLENN